mmetsp:Transcript_24815/g.74023  ORF Transcript_24815/g.74023 Transcript_24815/m.74023 type:complete len:90 (-) Transcript_24815:7-276(-)
MELLSMRGLLPFLLVMVAHGISEDAKGNEIYALIITMLVGVIIATVVVVVLAHGRARRRDARDAARVARPEACECPAADAHEGDAVPRV